MNRKQSVHTYFGTGNWVIHTGTIGASILIIGLILLGRSPDYVTNETVALLSFATVLLLNISALLMIRAKAGFMFLRDSLPYISFPGAMILSGNHSKAMYLLLGLAIVLSAVFYINRRRDVIDEENDMIKIPFRWPF